MTPPSEFLINQIFVSINFEAKLIPTDYIPLPALSIPHQNRSISQYLAMLR